MLKSRLVTLLITAAASLLGVTWAQAQAPAPGAQKAIVVEAGGGAPPDALRLVPPIGHTGPVADVMAFPDGRRAVTAAWDGAVVVWDMENGRQLRTFRGHADAGAAQAYSAAVQPGGGRVASCANDGYIRVWDPDTGQEHSRFRASGALKLRWTSDGGILVAGHQPLVVYDPLTGAKRREFPDVKWHHYLDLAPDGRTFVTGYGTYADAAKGIVHSGTAYVGDAVTGAVRHAFPHPMSVNAVAISRDGSTVATADLSRTIYLWSAATGQKLHELKGLPADGLVSALQFTADGTRLLSGGRGNPEEIWTWSVATGQKLRAFPGTSQAMDLTPDGGRVISATGNESVTVWNTETGLVLQRLAGSMETASGVALSPDGTRVLAILRGNRERGYAGAGLRLWDIRTGRPLRRYPFAAMVLSGAYSPDGKLVAVGGQNNVTVWEVETGKVVRSVTVYGFLGCLQFSPDSKRLLTAGGSLNILDIETGAVTPRGGTGSIVAAAFSPDGSLIAAASGKELLVLRADTGAEVRRLPFEATHPTSRATGVTFSRDGQTLALVGYFVPLHRWEVATGQRLGVTPTPILAEYAEYRALTAGPDGMLAFNGQGGVSLFDARGTLLGTLPHPKHVGESVFLHDGRLLTAATDGVLRLWEPKSGALQLSYLPLQNDEWLAIAGDGRFDGSEGGIAQVFFARGTQTYDLDQFAEQFRAPGVVGSVVALAGEPPAAAGASPAPNAAAAVASGAPPKVAIVSPTPGAASAEAVDVVVEAAEQGGGGFGGIRLYHNGRLVAGPPAIRGIEVVAAAPAEALKKSFAVRLVSGENVLRATALSRTGLESAPAEVKLTYAAAPAGKPVLHVLAVGINKYRDGSLDLAYARPDAEAIGGFFQTSPAAKSLFSEVKVSKLVDETATGEAIRQALAGLAAGTKPDDVVFLYFAGHGEMAPAKDAPNAPETFFFLPAEMRQIALKERVRELGISGAEIEGTIQKMAARKIVLVYDACKSGGAVAGGVRGAADEQQALGALARAQGIHILTASTSQQYAGEVKALGHGILTYALLEGLKGKAARSGNPAVYVRELMSYVEDRVPQLAREHRGREQWPVPFGRGQNFPVVLGGS